MEQLKLNFDGTLLSQFPYFGDCVRASVYSCGKPFKNIAADLDLSPSMLSRMLNTEDTSVNFPAYRLPDLIQATNDTRPVEWVVLKFITPDDANAAMKREIRKALPLILRFLEQEETAESNVHPIGGK